LPGELYRWLSDSREHPFFLFLHGYDAHEPHVLGAQYDAKRFNPDYTGPLPSSDPELQQRFETDNKDGLRYDAFYQDQLNRLKTPQGLANADLAHLKTLYDAQIYYLDQGLGGLFTALNNLKLMDRTVIIILSDHGQAFGEHGEYATHAQLYDEIIRTVLIIKDPRRRLQGARIPNVVQLVDVMPTILELLDIPVPSGVAGRSLVPLLDTGQDPKREEIAVTLFDGAGLSSIRTAEWKLITLNGTPSELYHLSRDPGEQTNRLNENPSVVRKLQERLSEVTGNTEQSPAPSSDPKEWLQKHGYW
jgi:arylsulfatase A-like enzyme